MSFQNLAREFLDQQRIAVVGVSRTKSATGNLIYKALKGKGYTVFPVHSKANKIEGDTCYPNLQAIPDAIDGVFVVTRPEVTEKVVRDAVEANVPRMWMHYNALFGEKSTSVSKSAVDYGREHGLTIIDGGCPMMFLDFPHKCMRWVLGAIGKLPE